MCTHCLIYGRVVVAVLLAFSLTPPPPLWHGTRMFQWYIMLWGGGGAGRDRYISPLSSCIGADTTTIVEFELVILPHLAGQKHVNMLCTLAVGR